MSVRIPQVILTAVSEFLAQDSENHSRLLDYLKNSISREFVQAYKNGNVQDVIDMCLHKNVAITDDVIDDVLLPTIMNDDFAVLAALVPKCTPEQLGVLMDCATDNVKTTAYHLLYATAVSRSIEVEINQKMFAPQNTSVPNKQASTQLSSNSGKSVSQTLLAFERTHQKEKDFVNAFIADFYKNAPDMNHEEGLSREKMFEDLEGYCKKSKIANPIASVNVLSNVLKIVTVPKLKGKAIRFALRPKTVPDPDDVIADVLANISSDSESESKRKESPEVDDSELNFFSGPVSKKTALQSLLEKRANLF